MLQLSALNLRAREAMAASGASLGWETPAELEALASDAVERLRALRSTLAAGPTERLGVWLDWRLETDAVEYLDRPDYSQDRKLAQVRLLHLQNRATGSYRRFLSLLLPAIKATAANTPDGRARVLELASGSGELTMELARLAAKSGAPFTITGSDRVQAFVDDGNLRARARGLDASFRRIDAFELEGVSKGEVDVVFIAQSIHHFTAGQLARMIARAGEIGARHFIGIDGYRSLGLLGVAPALAALTLRPTHTHDAFVSARKFYPQAELALIAEIAAPCARVSVERAMPAFSVLRIEYQPEGKS